MTHNYKCKLFVGCASNMADRQFNQWVKDKDIEIVSIQYNGAATSMGHSMMVLYKEVGIGRINQ